MFVLSPIFVKMMKRKKVARNRFSNFDSPVLLAMLHRLVSSVQLDDHHRCTPT